MPVIHLDDTDAEVLQGYIAEILDSDNDLGFADITTLTNILEQLYEEQN